MIFAILVNSKEHFAKF